MEEDKKVAKAPQVKRLEPDERFIMNIPQCCREGWDTCPHVAKREKPKKRNIGL
jgi:hypothetical protein